MKDYCKIEENKDRIYYYNKDNQRHRLTGPAVEWKDRDKSYWINDIYYMYFNIKKDDKLYIWTGILKLISEYEQYIKQNIKDLIQKYNPTIELYDFEKEKIKQLPNWLKDLIIL